MEPDNNVNKKAKVWPQLLATLGSKYFYLVYVNMLGEKI